MDIGYEGNPLPQTFEVLEQKFHNDIMKLANEQNDAEDSENARHKEVSTYFKVHFLFTYCGLLIHAFWVKFTYGLYSLVLVSISLQQLWFFTIKSFNYLEGKL